MSPKNDDPKWTSQHLVPSYWNSRNCLEWWLWDHFKSSAFNTCPHQLLQVMMGGHWTQLLSKGQYHQQYTHLFQPHTTRVKQDLNQDIALNIIGPILAGTLTTWCLRMVFENGSYTKKGYVTQKDIGPVKAKCCCDEGDPPHSVSIQSSVHCLSLNKEKKQFWELLRMKKTVLRIVTYERLEILLGCNAEWTVEGVKMKHYTEDWERCQNIWDE